MITIFIKSYERDFKLLAYALRSIKMNVKGNYDVVLLIDANNQITEPLQLAINELGSVIRVEEVQRTGNGYLFQQWCKLNAHKYTNSQYIMYSDSDVIFTTEINLDEFIKDGKPEILYTSWDKVGQAICWKEPTEAFMREPVEFEFMRRNNCIFHRSTLEGIEQFDGGLRYRVLKAERFSEFNAMGAYAYKFERDKYNFVNTDEWQYTPPKGEQLWSWAEKSNSNKEHIYEYNRTLEIINKTFGLNLTEL